MPHDNIELTPLGGLLHDIGKFRERTFEPLPTWAESLRHEARYNHEPFSALFVDEWLTAWPCDLHSLQRLVLKHHNPELPDERLVSLADRLSANERAEARGDAEGARGRAESALCTVLSRIEVDGHRAETQMYNELRSLSLDQHVVFPRRAATGSAQAYQELWRNFTHEVTHIPRGDGAVSTLLALLRKYTWAIPSDTHRDVVPDISLYHHLKTTAAIAACLVREELTEDQVQTLHAALTRLFLGQPLTPTEQSLVDRPLCALVKGDISGTQDFLYLLTSSGAARGLRGRSFYLQLLTEVIAGWIVRRFALSATNLIFAGGGHFYLLLPYAETIQKLDQIRQQIAVKLWGIHQGDVSLTIDCVPVAACDFLSQEAGGKGFATKWDEVSRAVNERKQHKWRALGEEAMQDQLFTAQQHGTTAEEMCQVCHGQWQQGVDSLDNDIRKCRRCDEFERLGRRLRDPGHLILFTVVDIAPPDSPDWRTALQTFGVVPWIVQTGEEAPMLPRSATAAIVYTFGSTEFLTDDILTRFRWGGLPVSYDFRWLADASPLQGYDADGQPVIAEFSDLARASDGVEWLGVLRMDVDSLGDVFKRGLGHDATISRMSTLSESLRLFFEAWVPRICRTYNPPDGQPQVYLLYAGGDDLFVVGAWSALPELARQIRTDFHEFVGGEHITLSGGIAIEHQKFPLYQLAESAKHALDDQAKEYRRPNSDRKKDALCFLQMPMGWERFDEVQRWQNDLLNMLKPDGAVPALPRGFLSRLMEIHTLYTGNRERQQKLYRSKEITLHQMQEMIQYDRWQWRLVYQLSRFGERHKEHEETINRLRQAILRQPDGLIADLRVLARWTALLMREG